MNGEAKELRELARQDRALTSESRISSVAAPAVSAFASTCACAPT